MNLKQLSILIVLGALLGGLGLYLQKGKNPEWRESASGQKLLGDFPFNDVSQILIKTSQGELNLVKDDTWKVKERYNYPANFNDISEFLRKAWELKGVQEIKAGQSQWGRLDLLPPDKGTNSGTLVEFKDKSGKVIRSLLLGKKHNRQSESPNPMMGMGMGDMGGWPNGRFVAVQGQQATKVWLVSDAMSNIEPKPDAWLNKDFFKVEKLKSADVVTTVSSNDWKLAREAEGGELKLADKKATEELDSSKVSGMNSLFSWPSFKDVASPEVKPESLGLDKPVVATLETFDSFLYTIKVGKTTNEENYALQVKVAANLPAERAAVKDEKKEDKEKLDKEFKEKNDKLKEKLKQEQACEKWTYLVDKWTVDQLLKVRSDLLSTNPPAPKVEPPKPDAIPSAAIPAPLAFTNVMPAKPAPAPVAATNSPASKPAATNAAAISAPAPIKLAEPAPKVTSAIPPTPEAKPITLPVPPAVTSEAPKPAAVATNSPASKPDAATNAPATNSPATKPAGTNAPATPPVPNAEDPKPAAK